MTIRTLTSEEATALHAFAAKFGRTWKAKLAGTYWANARVWNGHACLHGLRNDPAWGHEGLQAYQLPKVTPLAVATTCKLAEADDKAKAIEKALHARFPGLKDKLIVI